MWREGREGATAGGGKPLPYDYRLGGSGGTQSSDLESEQGLGFQKPFGGSVSPAGWEPAR